MRKCVFVLIGCTMAFCVSMHTVSAQSDVQVSVQPVKARSVSQTTGFAEDDPAKGVVYTIVDKMPEFPGGTPAFRRYLYENVKYPQVAYENGIEGRVICSFVVNKDGTIADVEVIRSGGDPSLDNEAVRVLLRMPRWKAGMLDGRYVRVKYTVPLSFKLPPKASGE